MILKVRPYRSPPLDVIYGVPLSTIVKCDKIFVVSQGKVVEHGTHQELVEKEGIYAAMYERQDGTQ